MHTVLSIVNITACLVISLACGIVMGRKRKEVNDRSTAWLQQVRLPRLKIDRLAHWCQRHPQRLDGE